MSIDNQPDDGLSIMQILHGMFRHKLLIAVPPILGLMLGGAYIYTNKPRYLAEAQIIIENQFTPFDKTVGTTDTSGTWQVSDHMVSSQVSAMKSDDIAARVVDELSLDKNPEYNANLRSHSFLGTLAVTLGFKDDPSLYTAKAMATKTLASDLTIYPIPDSNVIGIKSAGGDPAVAAAAANAIAETYVLTTREAGATSTDRARDWLAKQIEDLRAKVAQSDQAVERYRADAGLIRGASSTLGTQQISELNTQIGLAENARIEAQTKAEAIALMLKTKGDISSSPEVLASPSLQRLKDEQIAAAREITQISAVYLPSHPKMIAAQHHLDAVNNQIKVEAQRVVESLKSQQLVATERSASLKEELDKLKASETKANFSDVRLQALQRDAEANRTLLQSMLSRFADANARQDTSLQPGFARIIQKAVAPSAPYFPKTGPTLLLTTLAGLLGGLSLAFILEILAQPALAAVTRRNESAAPTQTPQAELVAPRLDMPVQAASELPQKAAAVAEPQVQKSPFICRLPAVANIPAAIALLENASSPQNSALTDSVNSITQNLSSLAKAKTEQTFACASIGSQMPNAALMAIAIGRGLANNGKRVMLVDLAPRKASAESLLGVDAGTGLSDLVSGKTDFTRSVVKDTQSKMHFVRYGAVFNEAQEEIVVTRLPAIATALHMVYDVVIFNVGEARAGIVQVLANADVNLLITSQSRLAETIAAGKAIEDAGHSKCLMAELDDGASSQIKASA